MEKNNKTACCITSCDSTTSELTFKFPAKENGGCQWLKAINSDTLKN